MCTLELLETRAAFLKLGAAASPVCDQGDCDWPPSRKEAIKRAAAAHHARLADEMTPTERFSKYVGESED